MAVVLVMDRMGRKLGMDKMGRQRKKGKQMVGKEMGS